MNTKHLSQFFLPAGLLLATAILQGCSGSGSNGEDNDGSSYLVISQADLYFGTRDVGTRSTQTLTLTNQSADEYTINSIALTGSDTKDFVFEYDENGMTLNPGEELDVALTFLPTSIGPKKSALDVDHDIVVKASNKQNKLEQKYYKARQLERSREFDESLVEYQGYIAGDPATVNKQRANIKVPVLTESTSHDDSNDVRNYTLALDRRDRNDFASALEELDKLLEQDPQSYLADDALYLKGYIYLVDLKDFDSAYYTMLELRFRYPDSSYYDTALYVEAISLQEQGDKEMARDLFTQLRDRHTGLSIEVFDVQWPKDNYLSRLWFERSDQGLESL